MLLFQAMDNNKISNEVFDILLHLSRLDASENERKELSTQVNQLVNYFEVLDKFSDEELDNSMYKTHDENSLRNAEIKSGLTASDLKKISDKYMDGYFSVPKVLGSGA